MQKVYLTGIYIVLFIMSFFGTSYASWLFYNKPEYKGKIIDSETKEPIEGAVVVAIYYTHPIISGPAGGSSSIIHFKEVLTDNNGNFLLPSYKTFIQPNSKEDRTEIIIFKPGYGSYPRGQISPPTNVDSEHFFTEKFGSKGQIGRGTKAIKFIFGLVELPKFKTPGERLKNLPGFPSEMSSKDSPIFYKLLNEERKRLGLGEVK